LRFSRYGALLTACVALACWACAVDFRSYADRLDRAETPEAKRRVLREMSLEEELDSRLVGILQAALEDEPSVESVQDAEREVWARAVLAGPRDATVRANPSQSAARIKQNPLYRDVGIEEGSNWMQRAIERLAKLFQRGAPEPGRAQLPETLPRTDWFVMLVWVLLGLAFAAFLAFAIRHFAWQRGLKRRSKAMMEEDEPERTGDEWLALGKELAGEGRFREAVRCLFLACLLRLDEAGVARFDRGQTNWEHLVRIEASPRRPKELDFRAPTTAFDRIWYGFKDHGRQDYDDFEDWYTAVTAALSREAA